MTVEQLLDHWQKQITAQKAEFASKAASVAAWDDAVRQHTAAVSRLSADTERLEREQAGVESMIDGVEEHQRFMAQQLDTLEADLDAMLDRFKGAGGAGGAPGALAAYSSGMWAGVVGGAYGSGASSASVGGGYFGLPGGGGMGGGGGYGGFSSADEHREGAYKSSAQVSSLLNDLAQALRTMVDSVNKEFDRHADDPLERIRRTLDNQMTSLLYVDRAAKEAEAKAADLAAALGVIERSSAAMAATSGGGGFAGSTGGGYAPAFRY